MHRTRHARRAADRKPFDLVRQILPFSDRQNRPKAERAIRRLQPREA